jgi:hypothetical protein
LGVSRRRSLHAVAFSSRLLPTRSAEDFHLQSSAHAWHTKGKSLRDSLRPPLTVTVRGSQSKFGRDEKMVPSLIE